MFPTLSAVSDDEDEARSDDTGSNASSHARKESRKSGLAEVLHPSLLRQQSMHQMHQQIQSAVKKRESTLFRQATIRRKSLAASHAHNSPTVESVLDKKPSFRTNEGTEDQSKNFRSQLLNDLSTLGGKWAEEHEALARKAYVQGLEQNAQDQHQQLLDMVRSLEMELERHRSRHTAVSPATINQVCESGGQPTSSETCSLSPRNQDAIPHPVWTNHDGHSAAPNPAELVPTFDQGSYANGGGSSVIPGTPCPNSVATSAATKRALCFARDGSENSTQGTSVGEVSAQDEFASVVPHANPDVQTLKPALKKQRSVVVSEEAPEQWENASNRSNDTKHKLSVPYEDFDAGAFHGENFPMWSMWNAIAQQARMSKRKSSKRNTVDVRNSMRDFLGTAVEMTAENTSSEDGGKAWQRKEYFIDSYIMQPNSSFRIIWDLLSVLFVAFDCIVLPLQFLDPPEIPFLVMAAFTSKVFFCFDFVLSFLTGYFKPDGMIERGFKHVVLHYFKTWLVFDASMLATDWATLLAAGQSDLVVMRPLRLLKFFRMLRLLRLLRLGKYEAMAQQYLSGFVNTEVLSVIFSIVKIVAGFTWLNHLIACVWYGIANSNANADKNWVEHNGLFDRPLAYRYAVSFHWSLSLFSGVMEVGPQNEVERLFNILVVILTFFAAAWIVSIITSEMTNLEIVSASATKQLNALRKYLGANSVSQSTCLQIHRNVKNAMHYESMHPPEHSVKLLTLVSEPMKIVLNFEMHIKWLSAHPFLREYAVWSSGMMKRVCHTALSRLLISKGEVLFCAAEVQAKPQMYFVKSGTLDYAAEDLNAEGGVGKVEQVDVSAWFCDPALFTPWEHFGTMTARTDCEILVMNAEVFVSIAIQAEKHGVPAYKFGYKYLELLNTIEEAEITDLHIKSIDLEVLTMEIFNEQDKPEGAGHTRNEKDDGFGAWPESTGAA